MKNAILLTFLICLTNTLFGQKNLEEAKFIELNSSSQWKKKFDDKGTRDWNKKWFLDGLRAEITNSKEGLIFSAGPTVADHACHAVLWTKVSFEGDIKIEFDYTRTDTRVHQVNIIYIQATGIDISPYSKDIREWSNLRKIPYMRHYFENMNAFHISYAAFDNEDPSGIDYIRARKYPVLPGADFNSTTEIPPASFGTGLFIPGETYRITVIKTSEILFFSVANKNISQLYTWDISAYPPVTEGRIGIRHMFTRSAVYRDFKVYTK